MMYVASDVESDLLVLRSGVNFTTSRILEIAPFVTDAVFVNELAVMGDNIFERKVTALSRHSAFHLFFSPSV